MTASTPRAPGRARGMRRHWALVAPAAAVGTLLSGAALLGADAPGAGAATTTSTDRTHQDRPRAKEGTNRRLAVAEAAKVLGSIPVPAGSRHADSAPIPSLAGPTCWCGTLDPTLTRTGYWVVPLSPDALVAWYADHSPADTGDALLQHPKHAAPASDLRWQVPDVSPAFTSPIVFLSYVRLDPHSTAIRTDVFLASLFDRTAETLVPASVTRVDITRQAIDGPDRTVVSRTVEDAASRRAVTALFNDLEGGAAGTRWGPCSSPVGIVYAYDVTFHWPGHAMTVGQGSPMCRAGRGLTLDGTTLPEKLDNEAHSDAFDLAIQRVFESS